MTAVRRIRAAALPDLPDASWSNALLVGEELVMSGMTAHPATRQAAEGGGALCAHPPGLVVGG
ncbi:RidA family protein, partial [Pseudomonas aeruginosa]